MNNKYNMNILKINFLVPKMHVKAHGARYTYRYDPGLHPAVGRVDGECMFTNLPTV